MEVTVKLPDSDRYGRLKQIQWWRQQRLSNARVLVAGAGALGNELLKNLVLLGVGHIVVVDFDVVSLSNLTRSVLFREGDLDQSKVGVAACRAKDLNPDVKIWPIHGNLAWDVGHGIFRRMDLVLGGLDNIAARAKLNRICMRYGIPYIDGGLNALEGMMQMFDPSDGACFECHLSKHDYREMNQRNSCQVVPREVEGEAIPTSPTIASTIAAWQVQEAVKYLHDLPVATSKRIIFDGLQHRFAKVHLSRNPQCLLHTPPMEVLSTDLTTESTLAEVFAFAIANFGTEAFLELDRFIVSRLSCWQCGLHHETHLSIHALAYEQLLCGTCAKECQVKKHYQIKRDEFDDDLSLKDLGIPPLHVFGIRDNSETCHFIELTGDLACQPQPFFSR